MRKTLVGRYFKAVNERFKAALYRNVNTKMFWRFAFKLFDVDKSGALTVVPRDGLVHLVHLSGVSPTKGVNGATTHSVGIHPGR